MVENGAQLVEVLPREAYEAEHLPRAITIRKRASARGSLGDSSPEEETLPLGLHP
jgi:hypothetical protein